MLELLQMWALVEVLGFICLPLTITVFQNLPDRGWPFTKAIGMALLAFCVWLPLMCFQMLPFSQFFILGVLLLIVAFNIIGFLRVRKTLLKVIRTNIVYIVICEAIFLGMMFLLGWIRSYVPDIRSFEMFMDEGFLAAIMRSPHMPPNDMWYSGYPINYYYYAHFTMGVLAKLLGQSPSIAFNTGICTFYGLTAVNLFGVTCNIVTWARHTRQSRTATTGTTPSPSRLNLSMLRAIPYGLMTILMALILGNLAATQEWWDDDLNWSSFDWFWKPTRVVGSGKTINEFPAFSFLLSCFHAHVLALAFTILAIGLALNLFLEPDGKGLFVFGRGWRLPFTIGMTALVLGGLFTMNGWDFPTYLGLAIVCIALQQWLAYGMRFHIELALDIFTACAGLAALSFLLYAPFYLSFISPSQGIGLVGSGDRSPLSSEILIYGMFAFIFISLLLATVFRLPFFTGAGATAPKDTDGDDELVVVTLSATDEPSSFTKPDTENRTVAAQPLVANKTRNSSVESQPPVSPKPRSAKSTPWIAAIIFIIVAAVITFFVLPNSITFVLAGTIAAFGVLATLYNLRNRAHAFTLLLGTIAFALVALCEIVFLKDVFADNFPRMNTVFKFYFQAWALLSLTCGTGLYFILESFRPLADALPVQRRMQRSVEGLWAIGLLGLMLASAVYPLVGTYARTNHYAQRSNSLDGIDYLQTCKPPDCDYDTSGDYAAIHWINGHISGDPVIVEAVGDDYTSYGRISAFTGLPSPMGWVGHEYQWRVNWINNGLNAVDFNSRKGDVDTIYQDSHPNVVLSLLARYHVQYLYVGLLEQMKYPGTDLHRFAAFMNIVYSAKGVTIYQVR